VNNIKNSVRLELRRGSSLFHLVLLYCWYVYNEHCCYPDIEKSILSSNVPTRFGDRSTNNTSEYRASANYIVFYMTSVRGCRTRTGAQLTKDLKIYLKFVMKLS